MTPAETALRQTLTDAGMPQDQQDQLIAANKAKAQPGAMVGPWRIPYREELTPAGIQLAMFDKPEPPPRKTAQLSLF